MNKILQWLFVKPTEQKKVFYPETYFSIDRCGQKPDKEKYFKTIPAKHITMKDDVWIGFPDGRIERSFISNLKFAGDMLLLSTHHHGDFYFYENDSKSDRKKHTYSDKYGQEHTCIKECTCYLSLQEKIPIFIESEKRRIAEHELELKLTKACLAELEEWQKTEPALMEN